MVKAKLSDGTIILGLSAENITRLQDGKPIRLNLKDMGLEDRQVFIVYGETEEKIYTDLPFAIDPDKTKFK